MCKTISSLLIIIFCVTCSLSISAKNIEKKESKILTISEINNKEKIRDLTEIERVSLSTIYLLYKNGVITESEANQEFGHFLENEDRKNALLKLAHIDDAQKELKQAEESSDWVKLFNLVNLMKLCGVLLLIAAVAYFIAQTYELLQDIGRVFWRLICTLPAICYQILFVIIGLTLALVPMIISISEAQYVVIFGVLLAYVALVWWTIHYEEQSEILLEKLSLGLPIGMVWSFYHAIYFGFFAIREEIAFLQLVTFAWVVLGIAVGIFKLFNFEDKPYKGTKCFSLALSSTIVTCIILFLNQSSDWITPYYKFTYYGLVPLLLLSFSISGFYLQKPSWVKKFSNIMMFSLLFISAPLPSFGLDNLYAMINSGVFAYGFITITTMVFRVSFLFGLISTSLVVYVLALVIEHNPEKFMLYI